MKKLIHTALFFLPAMFALLNASAQTDASQKMQTYRVGIFAPLYLDSVFTPTGTFRFKDGMPKFITPAVDFVNGVQVGFDSLQLDNVNINAYIYDTKSYTEPISTLIKNKKINDLDLIIGSVRDNEYRQLADFAFANNIPFISATYPNDGGITGNPFVVLLNSTLKAHCEAIYTYILQNHGTDKIFLCRKKGTQEDKIASYFKAMNEQDGKPLLSIQTLNFDSTVSPDFLKSKLDSNRQTVIIGGSLEEGFAMSVVGASYNLFQTYPIKLIGMPNWDAFKGLMKKDTFEDFPVYFTTPYFNTKADSYSKILIDAYAKKLKGKPSDMAFKGFECAQLFTRLLAKYPADLINHLNDKSYKIFTDYNFRPVMLNKAVYAPDYYENKHLYFIRILNGATYKAW
jgi:Periplasmic binding protein